MENIFGSVHYNSIAVHMKEEFGCRVVKLALDGGFTCPNRDGTKGTGGCIYCSESGSGDFASDVPSQIRLISPKWPEAKYMAYFQNHTNTYASVERLRGLWDKALSYPDVVGLAIATRPDCLPDDVLNLLSEYNEKTYLWVELGLQTSRDDTAVLINRCYETSVFEDAMKTLKKRGIRVVVHEILGLPGENSSDALNTALYAASFGPFGIKLHMLHVMEGTRLGEMYAKAPFPIMTKEEYVNTVVDILERTPQSVTVHRLTGDAPRSALIAPDWTKNKHVVLGAIQHEFSVRNSFQGKYT